MAFQIGSNKNSGEAPHAIISFYPTLYYLFVNRFFDQFFNQFFNLLFDLFFARNFMLATCEVTQTFQNAAPRNGSDPVVLLRVGMAEWNDPFGGAEVGTEPVGPPPLSGLFTKLSK